MDLLSEILRSFFMAFWTVFFICGAILYYIAIFFVAMQLVLAVDEGDIDDKEGAARPLSLIGVCLFIYEFFQECDSYARGFDVTTTKYAKIWMRSLLDSSLAYGMLALLAWLLTFCARKAREFETKSRKPIREEVGITVTKESSEKE